MSAYYFIDYDIKKNRIPGTKKDYPYQLKIIDGKIISSGPLLEGLKKAELIIETQSETRMFYITHLANYRIVIGFDWLRDHNPTIIWTYSTVNFSNCPACHLSVAIIKRFTGCLRHLLNPLK
jgi:hypothetical protein